MIKTNISKTKYTNYIQCPKILYLDTFKPNLRVISDSQRRVFETGNQIGDLAMGLFGEYVEVTEYNKDGSLNISKMIENTKKEIANKTKVICEASFASNGLYCAVDILKLVDSDTQTYEIYEVKSSTHVKDYHKTDVSFQKHLLEKCGIKVSGCYVVTLNSKYVLEDSLDIQKLFKITNVDEDVNKLVNEVDENINKAIEVLNKEEPNYKLSRKCFKPFECPFINYCHNLENYTILDLYRENNVFEKYIDNGITNLEDLMPISNKLSKIQRLQVENCKSDETYINKSEVKSFLDSIKYPVYYLDFESTNSALPLAKGQTPFSQVPFQYSLHYKQSEASPLMHKEFLAQTIDCEYEIAKSLTIDIPKDVTIIAFNASYEKKRILELSEKFPEFKEHLVNLSQNFIDLITPFRQGHIYNRKMKGSFSIKSILPSLFENDAELDYHALEGVHNGNEAKDLFPMLEKMNEEDRHIARNQLLSYCKLDTLAMVKIHEKLIELSK